MIEDFSASYMCNIKIYIYDDHITIALIVLFLITCNYINLL